MNGTLAKNVYMEKKRAEQYNQSQTIWKDGYKRAEAISVCKEDEILEIGPGPGILTLPLARRVRSIHCIEPSPYMSDLLLDHCKEQKIKNVKVSLTTIEDYWEADKRYDMVLASYSLMMDHLKDVLKKMDHLAKGRVLIYSFYGECSWQREKRLLKNFLYGRKDSYDPRDNKVWKIMDILNMIGRYPDIQKLEDAKFDCFYPSMKEAVEGVKRRCDLEEEVEEEALEAFIKKHYLEVAGGYLYLDTTQYTRIEWRK